MAAVRDIKDKIPMMVFAALCCTVDRSILDNGKQNA
jgi:hypothetical protein